MTDTKRTRRETLRDLMLSTAALAAVTALPEDRLEAAAVSNGSADIPGSLTLWYEHPATFPAEIGEREGTNSPNWLRALPVGNGRLGGMVYGDLPAERIRILSRYDALHDAHLFNALDAHQVDEITALIGAWVIAPGVAAGIRAIDRVDSAVSSDSIQVDTTSFFSEVGNNSRVDLE